MELLDYGYKNLEVNTLKNRGDVVKKVKLDKADSEIVDVVLKNNLNIIENVGDSDKDYEFEVKVNNIKLPVKVGDIVGKIIVYSNNRKVKEADLTVNKNISSLGFFRLLYNEFIDLVSGEF